MDGNTAALGPRGEDGRATVVTGTACASILASQVSSSPPLSVHSSPSACGSINQVLAEHFNAFESAINDNGSGIQCAGNPRFATVDAVASADLSRSSLNYDSPSILSESPVGIKEGYGDGIYNLHKDGKGEEAVSPMETDILSAKYVRKRTSDEALDGSVTPAASKSRKSNSSKQSLPTGGSDRVNAPSASSSVSNLADSSDNHNSSRRNNSINFASSKYSSNDKAPFVVYIYSRNNNASNQAAHPLLVSKLIANIAFNDIIELKKIGRGKIMAELKTAKAANDLVTSNLLEANNLRAFIPSYRTLRTGVVRDIPTGISTEAILQSIEAPSCKILEVERLNRKIVINGESKSTPSSTITVKFAGQLLPKYIFLFKTRHEVSPFIPKTKVCFNCYRVGHISASCRSTPRCLNCGQNKHSDNSSCAATGKSPFCINCKGEHLATSLDCPIAARQSAIASLAAINNIPLFEARKIIDQGHYDYSALSSSSSPSFSPNNLSGHNSSNGNPFSGNDPRFDFQNFPSLNNRSNHNYNPTNHRHNYQSNNSPYSQNFQNYNRFDALNSIEHNHQSLPQGQSASTYAAVASSGTGGRSLGSRLGTASRTPGHSHFPNQRHAPASTGQDSESPTDDSSPPASASAVRARSDPGWSAHLYPNGRLPSSLGNGAAFAFPPSSDFSNPNSDPNAGRDFVKEFGSFFFRELLAFFLRGEYGIVLDSSLKFILNYFNLSAPVAQSGFTGDPRGSTYIDNSNLNSANHNNASPPHSQPNTTAHANFRHVIDSSHSDGSQHIQP